MEIKIETKFITTDDAINGLLKIFDGLPTNSLDEWGGMKASFYVEALRVEIERLKEFEWKYKELCV